MKLYCRNCYRVYRFDRGEAMAAQEKVCSECGEHLAELKPITIDPPPKFLELCNDYNVKPEMVLREFIEMKIS